MILTINHLYRFATPTAIAATIVTAFATTDMGIPVTGGITGTSHPIIGDLVIIGAIMTEGAMVSGTVTTSTAVPGNPIRLSMRLIAANTTGAPTMGEGIADIE